MIENSLDSRKSEYKNSIEYIYKNHYRKNDQIGLNYKEFLQFRMTKKIYKILVY